MHLGGRQPAGTSAPSSISCSTRARPRVESFSSRVARYDGHITPPVAGVSARHLPTPVQRCTAVGDVAAVVPVGAARAAAGAARPAEPQVGVERRRVDQDAGVEQVVGVEQPP